MAKTKFNKKTIQAMATLSDLDVKAREQTYFTKQFNETLNTVDQLNKLDTTQVSGTSNVTGLSNVYREDIVEPDRMLSQKESLSNAKRTHKGYFVVKAIFDEQ